MSSTGISVVVFSMHALRTMQRRGLRRHLIERILAGPEQRFTLRRGREVLQSRLWPEPTGKVYLVRVFVDVDTHPPRVVTAYRTSRIEKYWRLDA